MSDQETPSIIPLDDLSPSSHSHEFVGAEHGDVPFSFILVHSRPGVGPKHHSQKPPLGVRLPSAQVLPERSVLVRDRPTS